MAALTAWPSCGRIATRSSANARSVPSNASVAIAAATSAVGSRTSRSARARTSMPSMPSVPLISASPSLACSVSGATPAVASAVAPSTSCPSASRAWPSPSRTSAAEASGARSPLAPSEPCSRTTGVTPALSRASIVSTTTGRAPGVAHRQAAGAQQDHRPDRLALDLRTHPGGVRADQRRLQLRRPLGGDHRVGERAEAGGHAVDRLRLVHQPLDDGRPALDDRSCVVAERRRADRRGRRPRRRRPTRRAARAPAAVRPRSRKRTVPPRQVWPSPRLEGCWHRSPWSRRSVRSNEHTPRIRRCQ